MKRRRLLLVIFISLGLLLGVAGILFLNSSWATALVEGPAFRQEMDKQTSKGLHFTGAFSPIHRAGWWSANVDSFKAQDGIKAMKSMEANGITATFNPLGIFLRRWQLDQVTIETGRVEIQTYEPQPPPEVHKPWYAIFMPNRVYLREVLCERADIIWHIRERESGFFGTRLVVTPYGRDFEYAATGGRFRLKPIPEMELRSLSMRITRPELTLFGLELQRPDGEGSLHVKGRAGLQQDRSVDVNATFEKLPLAPWLPEKWREGTRGIVSGEIHWQSPDLGLDGSSGSGRLNVADIRLEGLPLLDFLASAARDETLKSIGVDTFHFRFKWSYPDFEIEDLTAGAKGIFQLRGNLHARKSALGGTVQLGISPRYLEWIPKAREEIFQREEGGYFWTPINLSGTLAEPQSDLLPRLEKVLRDSPGVAVGLFFRSAGEWLEQMFQRKE